MKESPSKTQPPLPPIEIRGDQQFIDQTQQALILLQQVPQALRQVRQHIAIIEQGDHSAMRAYERPSRLEINNVTAFTSITWYAGILAHESQHAKLYYGGGPVWNNQQAEKICIEYQIQVASQLEAPLHELRFLRSLDGTHCDLNNDSQCDWIDYNLRQW